LAAEGFNGKLEVSGGINEQNLANYAKAHVDIISLGELTHSVKALDISLEIIKNKK
jgi:nicotinate-nucleotide pyrophosphorylase (carboxylating)